MGRQLKSHFERSGWPVRILERGDWDRAMAASVLMMIPILVFYLAFQRWFISSFVGSAVKG